MVNRKSMQEYAQNIDPRDSDAISLAFIDATSAQGLSLYPAQEEAILERYKQRQRRTTPRKGPFIPKTPERFVKRAIRGMLPYKKARGRAAFKRILCYSSTPESLKSKEIGTIESLNVLQTENVNFIKVQSICRHLGGK